MPRSSDELRRALESLYVQHERPLYNVAYRLVWSSDEARDVVQDAFVRIWRKRETIDWERAVGLAYRTVLGLAANRRRAQAVQRAFLFWHRDEDDDRSVAGPDAQLLAAEADVIARRCMDELPERLRSVLLLCTFSELDYAEIGKVLVIAPGTVASRRNEAVARLKTRIAEVTGCG